MRQMRNIFQFWLMVLAAISGSGVAAAEAALDAPLTVVRENTIYERYRIVLRPVSEGQGDPAYFVGLASAMAKIMPQEREKADVRFQQDLAVDLKAAKNETESVQIVVYCPQDDLHSVRVTATELRDAQGNCIPASAISASVVGFVKTNKPKHFAVSHVGWWSDPILSDLKQFDVRKNDFQPIWYSVRVPLVATAGKYHGTVTVQADGKPACVVPVALTVWDFALPKRPNLRTALSTMATACYAAEKPSPERLRALQTTYDRFLAEHRCSPEEGIYRSHGNPIPEWRLKLWAELDISGFCTLGVNKDDAMQCTQDMPESSRDFIKYEMCYTLGAAKEAGIADRGLVYVCDETHAETFPGINNVCKTIEKLYPGTLTLTTAIDKSLGTQSNLKDIGAYCPPSGDYDFDLAEQVRRNGKQVWWYFCGGDYPPIPNVFIESPAIDIRLFMGFMSYAYRTDGFLYWSMIYPAHGVKSTPQSPYTDWNPETMAGWNGEGYLMFAGHDGPITTIRMENWLDGMEDYEYCKLLERRLSELRRRGNATLADDLETKLAEYHKPGNPIVNTLKDHTYDPDLVQETRSRLAGWIMAAGTGE